MRAIPDPVPAHCSLAEFLRERYDYRHHWYPVIDTGWTIGLLSTMDVERVAPEELATRSVGTEARRPPQVVIVDADCELDRALQELDAAGTDEALVLDHRMPVGVLLAREARTRLEDARR